MSKALDSALDAVRRITPESEIDPGLWPKVLAEIVASKCVAAGDDEETDAERFSDA